LASALASALAPPLVKQSGTSFTGPHRGPVFLSGRSAIFCYLGLHMMAVMCAAADAGAFALLESVI
jgi:hypothetical protein